MRSIHNKYILLIILLTLINGCSANKKIVSDNFDKIPPVTIIDIEDIENETELSTIELLYVMALKLPVPDRGETYQSIIDNLNGKDIQYIQKNKEIVRIQAFAIDANTGKRFPFIKLNYFFKDGLLTKGPLSEDLSKRDSMLLNGLNISNDEL